MPAQFTKHFVQDLQQDIKIRQCGTIVFNADNLSNVITVDLYNGTEPYSGGGTVAGAVICPDGATVALDNGTLTGNVASVTLKADCFAIPGQIGVGVQVISGSVRTTVLKAIYNVELLSTDNMVDPDSRITASVTQLIADIEAATAEIPASDMASLMSGIAPTFSASTNYADGAYVYYNGTLYRFTAAHAAGSWTGTDATAVALGNDVIDLKSALNAEMDSIRTTSNLLDGVLFRSGGYYKSNGDVQSDANSIYTEEYIPVTGGKKYYFNFDSSGGSSIAICTYTSDKTFGERKTNRQPPATLTLGSTVAYVRISIYNGVSKRSSLVFSENSLVDGIAVSTLKNAVVLNTAQLEQIANYTEQEVLPDVYDAIEETADNLHDEISEIAATTNIIDKSQIKTGGYYNNQGGITDEENSIYIEDYISVQPGTYYYYHGGTSSNTLSICTYDSNKSNFLRTNFYDVSGTFTIPDTVSYIRFSVYSGISYKDDVVISTMPLVNNKARSVLDEMILLNENQINQVLKNDSISYSYNASSKTLALICDKTQYIIKRQTNQSTHLDSWRLFQGYIKINNEFQNMWNGTDAEGPILIEENQEHFISGFHGYEVYDNANIYIDSAVLDISTDASGICKSVMLYQSSTVYEYGTTNEAFKRHKRVRILGNDFNVQQRWIASIPCTVYRGAFCLMQCPKTAMINNNCWDTDLLLPMGAKSNVGTVQFDKKTRIGNFYLPDNTMLSLVAEVGCDNEYFTPYITDYGANARFKFYFDMYNGKTLAVGDELLSKFSFKVNELQ